MGGDLLQIAGAPEGARQRKPMWLKVRRSSSPAAAETRSLVHELRLNTVCEEAACPNLSECWSRRHVTVMILGSVCTRACAFCNVPTGRPDPVDADEPGHLAEAAQRLAPRHMVITSVDRDDLVDGGAGHFAACIEAVRRVAPETTLEVLTPDFRGKTGALGAVVSGAGVVTLTVLLGPDSLPAASRAWTV